jgi:hypothetical protein
MKTKTFECVEMKRKTALRIHEETKDMTLEQRQSYWQRKNDEFLKKPAERKRAPATPRP